MYVGADTPEVDRFSASASFDESLAAAVAAAVPSPEPDHRFLREDCGGVPVWEVRMLIDPPPTSQPLSPMQEESMLQMAQRAREDGHHWRAHTLAEQAYAGRGSLSVLLYLLKIRVDDLDEATFGAAAYHTMLRLLPLRDDERTKVLGLFKRAHKKMYTRRRHENAAVLIQYRAAQLRRARDKPLKTGASGGRLYEERLMRDVPSWTQTSAWERQHAPAAEPRSSLSTLKQKPGALEVPTLFLGSPGVTPPDFGSAASRTPAPAPAPAAKPRRTFAPETRKEVRKSNQLKIATARGEDSSDEERGPSSRPSRVAPTGGAPMPTAAPADDDSHRRAVRASFVARASARSSSGGGAIYPAASGFEGGSHVDYVYEDGRRRATVPLGAVLSGAPRERRAAPRAEPAPSKIPPRIAATFRAYDTHATGYLDARELTRALRDCGVELEHDSAVAQRIVHAYDDHPNGRLDLPEFARLVSDVEGGRIRTAAVHAATKPIRRPLVSPLIGAREARREYAAHLPMLSSYYRGRPQDTLEYEPRTSLEEWLDGLPGLMPQRPPPLLGVRPLERGEAIARFLRMECTLWEAQRAYVDSHRLYVRQWIALQLQALYRGVKARMDVVKRRDMAEWEGRMRSAVGWWRSRVATRCFYGWKALALKTLKAWGLAEKMVVRMLSKDKSLAFNTWAGNLKARKKASATLKTAIKLWQGGTVRAFRCWKAASAARHEKRRRKIWMTAAIAKPELRAAMNRWQASTRDARAALSSVRKVVGSWRNRQLGVYFRQWRGETRGRARASSRARTGLGAAADTRYSAQQQQQQLYWQSKRELMTRPCVKKGRYTGKWRVVQLQFAGSGLSYATYEPTRGGYAGGLTQTRVRTLQLGWIRSAHSEGVGRIRFSVGGGVGPAQRACWKWTLQLTDLGRQHWRSRKLTFGCQTADAMSCWVDELNRAVAAHAASATAAPMVAGALGVSPSAWAPVPTSRTPAPMTPPPMPARRPPSQGPNQMPNQMPSQGPPARGPPPRPAPRRLHPPGQAAPPARSTPGLRTPGGPPSHPLRTVPEEGWTQRM